jgi:hypothetical protein
MGIKDGRSIRSRVRFHGRIITWVRQISVDFSSRSLQFTAIVVTCACSTVLWFEAPRGIFEMPQTQFAA